MFLVRGVVWFLYQDSLIYVIGCLFAEIRLLCWLPFPDMTGKAFVSSAVGGLLALCSTDYLYRICNVAKCLNPRYCRLQAFGLNSEAKMVGSRSAYGSVPPTEFETTPCLYLLPAFLQACLGVKDGLRIAAPFIGAEAASRIIDASIAADVFGGNLSRAVGVVTPGPIVTSSTAGILALDRSMVMAALEGLLGVLVAAEKGSLESAPVGQGLASRDEDAGAIGYIRKRGLSLVLTTFFVCGGGSRSDRRLWSEHGAPALAKLSAVRPRMKAGDIWEEFLGGAVEYTRGVMEGVADGGERGNIAATLVLALVELERTVDSRGAVLHGPETNGGSLAPQQALGLRVEAGGTNTTPVLWRLGLTDPSVWREHRSEAFSRRGLAKAVSTFDLAQECIGSRWARRWETAAAVLEHFPDPRARLEFLAKGIPLVVGGGDAQDGSLALAGEVVQEMLTAGTVVARAMQLLKGCDPRGAGILEREDPVRDLPLSLSIRSTATENAGEGKVAKPAVRTAEVSYLEEFGVGLPSTRGASYAGGGRCAAEVAAASAAAGVVDIASVFLGVRDGMLPRVKSTDDSNAAAVDIVAFQEPEYGRPPFGLLLPRDLWRTAFKAPLPLGEKENPRPQAVEEEDISHHDLLLAALASAVEAVAKEAAMLGEGFGTAWTVWLMPCLAEVSTALVVSVVGEAFMLGLNLGEDSNRSVERDKDVVTFCVYIYIYI